ncbi:MULTISPECIES: 16S rRNA (guanine(966)-N(2))-methyltransferase RsmD [Arthrobacter]|uniref:16S rRNA (Guanine(966)-N(2))-methyltransferase RsmD n=2 Tax=Arthrobacter TaxID=1663 RepID=A0ABU9KF99_9MICC|nr:16S rRNA (guanine(966)-N(2))-methyltransferase RsmD [Arthrobacter sp. YJM1]MDP5225549.1 16S rRNA (guanine(966)-N(2))-methyltransferase RsmD [Arthrobacter sp. YJM1]
MSRIIAGVAGGLPLNSVPGNGTRPTTDRVKEALFSRLESYGVLEGAEVLDLFAGSGALGLEAGSRGAAAVTLVDLETKAVLACQKNAALLKESAPRVRVSVQRSKVNAFLERSAGAAWDLVFLDPPYPLTEDELAHVLTLLSAQLAEGAVVVVERSSRSPEPAWPAALERFAEKKYGETVLWFAEPA